MLSVYILLFGIYLITFVTFNTSLLFTKKLHILYVLFVGDHAHSCVTLLGREYLAKRLELGSPHPLASLQSHPAVETDVSADTVLCLHE